MEITRQLISFARLQICGKFVYVSQEILSLMENNRFVEVHQPSKGGEPLSYSLVRNTKHEQQNTKNYEIYKKIINAL
jgi:hypothetical protein